MSTTNLDTYIDCLGIDLEDLYEMSEADREAFYKEALADLSTTEATDLAADFEEALDDLRKETLDEYQEDLEDIIDDGDSTTEEIARAERALEEVEALIEFANGEETNFGAAQTELSEENVDATDGEPYTFSATDPENGQEYVIDATSSEEEGEDEGSWLDSYDQHAGDESYVDSDGNGSLDTQADTDGDGRADVDTTGDGAIDELDMLDYDERNSTNQTITLTVDGTVELASYDAETGTTRWAVTTENEDGETITYYITVKGFPDIKFTGDYTMGGTDIDTSWAPELLNRCYDSSSIDESFGDIMGVADPNAPTTDYYTKIDMADYYDETTGEYVYPLEPSATDFEEGREYVITCGEGYEQNDTINLNFDDDVELDFSQDENGNIVITATNADDESMTIVLENFGDIYGSGSRDNVLDLLNITGGIINEDDYADLNAMYFPVYEYDGTTEEWVVTYYQGFAYAELFGAISHNGTLLFDNEDCYNWYAENAGSDYSQTTVDPFE